MLRYGVLGLLIERRGYGYELVQRLATRLGAAWQLNPSAVYTALDQLEAAGLIEPAPAGACGDNTRDASPTTPASPAPPHVAGRIRTARRAERVIYRATEQGFAEFQAWLARPAVRVEPIRTELQLKVALVSPDSVPPLLASIAHEERLIMQSLQQECPTASEGRQAAARALRVLDGGEEQAGSDGGRLAPTVAAGSWQAATSALVSTAATARLQGELLWLQSVRETLQRMLGENVAASASPALVDAASLR